MRVRMRTAIPLFCMTAGTLPIAFSEVLPGGEQPAPHAKPESPRAHMLWEHDTGG